MSSTTAMIILAWALGAGAYVLFFYVTCRDEPDDDEWPAPGAGVV